MRIALAGNQNSGKTTLFNLLCGTNQKIGNWPGVTIEKKAGIWLGTDIEVLDLPGIYSLSPYSADEEVSRSALFNEDIDIIINIVDSTSIERSLYLTTQLLELDIPLIIALNMADSLAKKGLQVDHKKLEQLLGVSVFPISAKKNQGLTDLKQAITSNTYLKREPKKIFDINIEKELELTQTSLEGRHRRFVSVKLVENDPHFQYIQPSGLADSRTRLEAQFGHDAVEMFANERYRYIVAITRQVIVAVPIRHSISEKLDKVFLNKYLALPIFALIMFAMYFVSVGLVGQLTADWLTSIIGTFELWLTNSLTNWGASPWAVSLITHGVLGGATTLIVFVPQLIVLFLIIGLLETSGYIARISFFLDRVFHALGLSGRSLIPFIVGSGCSVPAILSSRTIENDSERNLTILLTPFIPCSAKLPIIALFATFFFPAYSGLVSFGMYFLAIVVIVLSALLLKRRFFKQKPGTFISELPDYHWPHPVYLLRDVFDKTWEFIRRAGSIIILSSIGIWLLASFSWKFEYGVPTDQSLLAIIGNLISWLFYPMLGGQMSWGAAVAALQGLIAKENVVASMAVISGISHGSGQVGVIFDPNGLFGFFTPVTAFAFIVFNLFSAPCIASIAAMKREFKTNGMMLKAILFQTSLAWILASLIGGIGTLIMKGFGS